MDKKKIDQLFVNFPNWIIVVICVSLIMNLVLFSKLNSIKQEINNLQSSVYDINSNVNRTLSNNINRINEILNKESSLITEFRYDFGELKDKRIDVLLNLKIKEYTKGEKVYFSCKIGKGNTELIEAKSTDDINYEAKVNISIFEYMDIDLIIDDGKTKKTQKLQHIYRPVDKIALNLIAESVGGNISYNKKKNALVINYEFELINDEVKVRDNKLTDVRLKITVNDKIVDTIPLSKNSRYEGRIYNINLNKYEVPCKIGDKVKFHIIAVDDKGFKYEAIVEGFKINENGSLEDDPSFEKYGKMEIKY